MFRIRPRTDAFGLDISDLVFRFLGLHRRGKKVSLRAYGEIGVPPDTIVEGEIRRMGSTVETLKQLLRTIHGTIPTRNAIASLPERKTFTKVLEIPNLPDREVLAAVKWEIEQHIPLNIDDAHLDWQPLGGSEEKGLKRRAVLVAVAPKTIVDSYTQLLDAVGLRVVALEAESAAVVRSVIPSNDQTWTKGTMIVDAGASRTGLIIYDGGAIQFTSTVNISGRQMTDLVAKRMRLNWDQAEKAKVIYGLEPKKGRGSIREILEPTVYDLGRKIKEVVTYYQDHFPKGNAVGRVVLCGGVAQMKFLPEVLANAVNLPISLANPWVNVNVSGGLPPQFRSLSFTTAIGLALRGVP